MSLMSHTKPDCISHFNAYMIGFVNSLFPDKHASMSLPPSEVIGCDFSGEVTVLVSEAAKSYGNPLGLATALLVSFMASKTHTPESLLG